MNEEIAEYYEELYRLYIDENQPLERRYRQLRESLERVVRERIQGNSLQTTDLAARINYVATQYGLDLKEQNQWSANYSLVSFHAPHAPMIHAIACNGVPMAGFHLYKACITLRNTLLSLHSCRKDTQIIIYRIPA